jgi:hypothetical protein
VCACRFDREAVASPLLERSVALDPEHGKHIDGSTGRASFIKAFEKSDFAQIAEFGLDAIPNRPRHQHDHQGLPLGQ